MLQVFLLLVSWRNAYRHAELSRFGVDVRGLLFIQLHTLRSHYLTVVVTIQGYRFALVGIHTPNEGPDSVCLIKDFGWIDPKGLILHHNDRLQSRLDVPRGLPAYVSDPAPHQPNCEVSG